MSDHISVIKYKKNAIKKNINKKTEYFWAPEN